MSEMVERVARAICKQRTGIRSGYETFSQNDIELARAAIEAMREPTSEIIKAHHVVPDDTDFTDRAARNWSAMIDAALGKVDA